MKNIYKRSWPKIIFKVLLLHSLSSLCSFLIDLFYHFFWHVPFFPSLGDSEQMIGKQNEFSALAYNSYKAEFQTLHVLISPQPLLHHMQHHMSILFCFSYSTLIKWLPLKQKCFKVSQNAFPPPNTLSQAPSWSVTFNVHPFLVTSMCVCSVA